MRTIRAKLFVSFGILLLSFLLFALGLIYLFRSYYLEAMRARLAEEALLAGEIIKLTLPADYQDEDLEQINAYIRILGEKADANITLVAPDGRVLGDSQQDPALMDNHLFRPEIQAARQGRMESFIRPSPVSGENMLYTAVILERDGSRIGYLRLALSLSMSEQAVNRVRLVLLLVFLLLLCLTLAITHRLSSGLIRPLAEIAQVAGRIAEGDLSGRVAVSGRDETGKLAGAINLMAESLQSQLGEISGSRDQLETILTTMVEGIIVFDGKGRAIHLNPAAKAMLGLVKGNWYGRRALEIVRRNDLFEKIMAVRQGQSFLEHEITTAFPEKKVLHVTLAPIRTAREGENGVLTVLHDITRLRKLEEMRADFAANVSHELRTPLTAISGFAETLLDGAYKDPETTLRFSQVIHREAKRLHNLIEDILKLSQIENAKTSVLTAPVDVASLASGAEERFSRRLQGYSFARIIPADLPPIAADAGLVTQAIDNLLDNAIKYTPLGGRISIEAQVCGNKVCICVKDSGIGIPEEAQERIFERFYRVDPARSRRLGGTGLGLAIVKHIVEAHRGELELKSKEGRGTEVCLKLPVGSAE